MSKRTYPRITSPRGVFIYPKLVEPDTKFVKPHGEYSTKLALQADDEATVAFTEKLTSLMDEYIAENPDDLKPAALKKAKRAELFEEELDDEGEETGRIVIRAKLKAMVETDSKSWPQQPRLFDAGAQPIEDGCNPWTGTEGKLNLEVFPYFMQSTKTFGLSLRLKGAQILKLVEGGGASAEDMGFGAEDGYSAGNSAPSDDSGFDDEAGDDDGDEEF